MSQDIIEQTTVVSASSCEQPHGLHSDFEGNLCAKRLFGSLFTSVGMLMFCILFVYGIFHPGINLDTAMSVAAYVTGAGVTFWGLTLPERLFNRR